MIEHEYIPLKRPVRASDLPSLAGIPELSNARISGISLPGAPVDDYLTFCDRLSQGLHEASACRSWVLVPASLAVEVERHFPNARIIPLVDARAVFIDALHEICAAGLNGRSSLLPQPGLHPQSLVDSGAVISQDVHVEAGAKIHAGSILLGPVWVRQGATILEGAIIGSSGMNAYVGTDGKRRVFPHVAATIIEPECHIGAQSVIMRGILSSTRVGPQSIIGSLCNIGHGTRVGKNCWISAGTIIGGHVTVADGATIGLRCTIRDNCSVGANANLGMGSVVTKNVSAESSVFGNPARRQHVLKTGPNR